MLCNRITDKYYDNINNVITAVVTDRMCLVSPMWPRLDIVHDYNEKRVAALLAKHECMIGEWDCVIIVTINRQVDCVENLFSEDAVRPQTVW